MRRRCTDGAADATFYWSTSTSTTSSSPALKRQKVFKAQMKKAFDMSNLSLLCFYLGIEVRQDTTGIALRQTHYAKRILKLSGMIGCNSAHTPMEEKLKLS